MLDMHVLACTRMNMHVQFHAENETSLSLHHHANTYFVTCKDINSIESVHSIEHTVKDQK